MGVLDLLFPKNCLNCGSYGQYICRDCLGKIRPAKQICPYCYKASIDGLTHIKCAKKFGLDGLICPWEYEGVVRRAILALKFKYATEVGKELNGLLVEWLIGHKELVPSASCLVPIPIHWHRENVRGFNQSIEVGSAVASAMGWKFAPDLLIKKKSTTSQVELSGDARRQNLSGIFSVNSNSSLLTLNSSLILFDDVFTTGSTLTEAAKTLKRGGVGPARNASSIADAGGKVWGLAIAR